MSRRVLSLLAGLTVLVVAGGGEAQQPRPGFFRVAPGPLSEAHAEWDRSDACEQCHVIGRGVTAKKCLSCHTHERLGKEIARGRGLHATFKERCIRCHREHRGRRYNITSWRQLGGRRAFDHRRTGFVLTGRHAALACGACHKRRTRSGRTSYQGLSRSCLSCHRRVHRFARPELAKDCTRCHPVGEAVRTLTGRSKVFDHARLAGWPLQGKHATIPCGSCHRRGRMDRRQRQGSCASCHRSPHGERFAAKTCTRCHAPTRAWDAARSAHGKGTRFPLVGKHRRVKCSQCHQDPERRGYQAPTRCAGCHRDPHRGRFGQRSCESCHRTAGLSTVRLNHGTAAGFALEGAHAKLSCRRCHRGRRPHQFERAQPVAQTGCTGCHAHRQVHGGQFAATRCQGCHVEGGSRTSPFDHRRDARFTMPGQHAKLLTPDGCRRCHPQQRYRTGKLACADCHRDPHRGTLGRACQRCHDPKVAFARATKRFSHDQVPHFKLTGLHAQVPCEKCHPKGRQKLGKVTCYTCHRQSDPHRGRLGTRCERCHTPTKGAPLFSHETMTGFARKGVHRQVACAACHQPRRQRPPRVGWTKREPPGPLDRGFPVMGRTCAECHHDPHAGTYGRHCETCHQPTRFSAVDASHHQTATFRLSGAHLRAPCKRCHDRGVKLGGLGRSCLICHREDDRHNNGLGGDCGRCHGQEGWRPARFNHTSVGFRLRGAHRVARCQDCHPAGQYHGIVWECSRCHAHDAQRARNPLHTAELNQCDQCHSETSFLPSRFRHPTFRLRGAHRIAACSGCHPGGRYAGTPTQCEGCHMGDYTNPATSPNHVAAGFSLHCPDCHSELSWRPARYWHQSFRRRGVHRTLPCASCHPGESYTGAFGGLGWDCAGCHGPGGPVDRWPPDHTTQGYPRSCELCHSEAAWIPARRPR